MADSDDTGWKARDAHSYDGVAEDFDRLTDRVSAYAATALADALPDDTQSVLDIGCGTGVVMQAVGRRLSGSAQITGLDLSPGMLATAKRKVEARGLAAQFHFVLGDAEAMEIQEGSMDAATSLYAWRHLPHPAKATAEVFRVLKPGGTFAVAVGSRAPLTSFAGIGSAVDRVYGKVAEAFGRQLVACQQIDALVEHFLPSTDATEEAEWTKAHHGFGGSLVSLVKDAGFKTVDSRWMGQTFAFDSAEEFWNLQTTFSSMARKRIADGSPETVRIIRTAFMDQCNAVISKGGKLVYRVGAALVIAVKPIN